jgi:hypothetical protein
MMEEYWIIGFGTVGRRALERLHQQSPEAPITVVDPLDPEPPPEMASVDWYVADGVDFLLSREITTRAGVSPWIVPALPRHLAFEWIAAQLRQEAFFRPIPVPEAVTAQLQNAMPGDEGQVFMSQADFICPDDCNEPEQVCSTTGEPRPYNLHAMLADMRPEGYRPLVIQSHQLAPGVGGFRARQLADALAAIRQKPGKYLLSTASKCHGVMHAFETARWPL